MKETEETCSLSFLGFIFIMKSRRVFWVIELALVRPMSFLIWITSSSRALVRPTKYSLYGIFD